MYAKLRPFLSAKLILFSVTAIILLTFNTFMERLGELYTEPTTQMPTKYVLTTATTQTVNNSTVPCPKQTPRKELCKNCSWHGFKYIVRNDHLCAKGNNTPVIEMLFLILTQHSRKLQRDVIRRTWASESYHNRGTIRYVFLLGISLKEKDNVAIVRESKIYDDILVESFIDSYENLTLKTIMGFKWASQKCSSARLVLKTDDDMWINMPALFNVSSVYRDKLQTTVGGNCFLDVDPDRDCYSKWYVSRDLYPRDKYAGFCSGTAYITSQHVAKRIYEISKDIPYFYLEDVYVGLCLEKIGYNVTNIPGFYNRNVTYSDNLCDYKKMDVVTAHKVSPLKIATLWNINCQGKNPYIVDFFKRNISEETGNYLAKIHEFVKERY